MITISFKFCIYNMTMTF